MIEQAAGRGDQHVDAAAEGMFLRPHPDAAVHRRAGDRRVHRQVVQIFQDLRRQLARRRQHQGAGRSARLVDQPVQDRQEKRRRLAAAGHGAGQHVAAVPGRRDGVRLNRRRADEAEILETLEKIGMKL